MDKTSKSRKYSVCKRKNNSFDINKRSKPKSIKKKGKMLQSTSPVQKNGNPKEHVKGTLRTEVVQIEKQDAGMKNLIEPFGEKTYAKSSYLMKKEIRLRKVRTVQDKFRFRIIEPTTKIEEACRNCKFYYLREPRYKKALIVLDLDVLKPTYPATNQACDMTMLNLLEILHCRFDIAVWSCHRMSNLIPKLENLGFFKKENKFKINFVLDRTAMTPKFAATVKSPKVKDLEVIWNLYPQYNERNCIMIDNHLKKVIYESYGIPFNKSKRDKIVDEVTMIVIIEFLVEIMIVRQSFAKLYIPIWKKFDD